MSKSQSSGKIIEVSAGLVFRGNKLLITERPANGHLGGFWEFPGGKREPGESFEQALHRELMEELGIEVEIRRLIESITHRYPEKTVHLQFFQCLWLRHEPQPLGCPAFAWIQRGQLGHYQFPAADAQLLERLAKSDDLWQ
ncbi:MAG: (deoxy)nucleoside triphosphate pyrophosphohydrolase [Verrucomicrobia bacterium]|nr:(deoxy)nucleoside triphosphate pyrophosphohydrolase [Verrucomicrobiota bacterium]